MEPMETDEEPYSCQHTDDVSSECWDAQEEPNLPGVLTYPSDIDCLGDLYANSWGKLRQEYELPISQLPQDLPKPET